jgi:HAD superfamily hydrolase (TIGR01509 family)
MSRDDPAVEAVRRAVQEFVPGTAREVASRRRILVELAELDRPFDRDGGLVHVTGSGLVWGPRGTVLLVHKKLGIWVQPGGHIEAGEAPGDAALRETTEETGLLLHHPDGGPHLVHLDVHPAAQDHLHLDLRFLLLCDNDADPAPAPGESQRVEWFTVHEAVGVADEGVVDGLRRLTGRALTGPALTGRALTGRALTGRALTGRALTKPAVQAVVFDFDGVVLDSEEPDYLAWQKIWSELGQDLPLEQYSACIGTGYGRATFEPFAELVRRTGEDLDEAKVTERVRALAAELTAGRPPFPGVVAWLEEAARAGLGIAVASSSPRQWVESHSARLGLSQYLTVISAFDDCGTKKPDPASYLLACDQLGVTPSQALAVEDSGNGLAAARAAGLFCVVVPNVMTAHMDFAEADLVLGSLTEAGPLEVITRLRRPAVTG